jgi:hypothetical protein
MRVRRDPTNRTLRVVGVGLRTEQTRSAILLNLEFSSYRQQKHAATSTTDLCALEEPAELLRALVETKDENAIREGIERPTRPNLDAVTSFAMAAPLALSTLLGFARSRTFFICHKQPGGRQQRLKRIDYGHARRPRRFGNRKHGAERERRQRNLWHRGEEGRRLSSAAAGVASLFDSAHDALRISATLAQVLCSAVTSLARLQHDVQPTGLR